VQLSQLQENEALFNGAEAAMEHLHELGLLKRDEEGTFREVGSW